MDGPTIRLMPGERRQQRVRIYGCDPAARVMVQSATWELHDFYGEVVGQGSCVVSRDNADVSYADTEMLEMAIGMVAQYTPSDYKDFSGVEAAVAAAQALLNAKPTVDRQDEVDAAAMEIFDAIAALEWAEGHSNNPIPYRHLMSVTEGLYYSYNGHIYRCLQSASSSMMIPGTAPRYWEAVT